MNNKEDKNLPIKDENVPFKRKRIGNFRTLLLIIKETKLSEVILSFFVFFIIVSVAIFFIEGKYGAKEFNNFGDALWFAFVSMFTVGFGDYAVTNFFSRILVVILVMWASLILAMIPAVIINYITDIRKKKSEMITSEYLEKLKMLPDLNKEELQEISNHVKKEFK